MITQDDIFQWAQVLIDEHGENAEMVAERWMQALAERSSDRSKAISW
jgi:hypothetical protein